MRHRIILAALAMLAACNPLENGQSDNRREFPLPDRPVSNLGSNQFSTETARDSVGEAQKVMDLAEIEPGMTVADIGAGNGYYTVRLAERVGKEGRVLAQDIDPGALQRLGVTEQSRVGKLIKRIAPGAKLSPMQKAEKAAPFATLTVTSGGDTGVGTLRNQIAAAASGDTIVFSGVTTVTLTSGELVINKNLTINGGTNGLADRQKYYEQAKRVLGGGGGSNSSNSSSGASSAAPLLLIVAVLAAVAFAR